MVQKVKDFLLAVSAPPGWLVLKRRLDSRILRTSYFWIFFVPLAASFLSKVPVVIKVPFFSQEVPLNVNLPFSWQIFYVGSLCFAAASFLYSANCPKLIKDFNRFSDYTDEGRGKASLEKEAVAMQEKLGVAPKLPLDLSGIVQELRAESQHSPVPERKGDIFHRLRDLLDHEKPGIQRTAHLLSIVGGAGALVIIFQNLYNVARLTFGS